MHGDSGVSAETQSKTTSLEDIPRELLADKIFDLEREIEGDMTLADGTVSVDEIEGKRKDVRRLYWMQRIERRWFQMRQRNQRPSSARSSLTLRCTYEGSSFALRSSLAFATIRIDQRWAQTDAGL